MKQLLSIVALLVITTIANAQTSWEKVELTPVISMSFPAKPTITSPANGVKSFLLWQADSTATYIVAVNNLETTAGMDAATLEAAMEQEDNWEQAKTAFVTSMGADAKLISHEMTTVKNVKAMRLIVDRKNAKGQVNTLTVLIFVQGANSINAIFNSRSGKGDDKMKEQFFNSIEVN